jgi:hypothetical protein
MMWMMLMMMMMMTMTTMMTMLLPTMMTRMARDSSGYLCAWLSVKLLVLDINGGTTEADILRTFDTAHAHLQQGMMRVTRRCVCMEHQVSRMPHRAQWTL